MQRFRYTQRRSVTIREYVLYWVFNFKKRVFAFLSQLTMLKSCQPMRSQLCFALVLGLHLFFLSFVTYYLFFIAMVNRPFMALNIRRSDRVVSQTKCVFVFLKRFTKCKKSPLLTVFKFVHAFSQRHQVLYAEA